MRAFVTPLARTSRLKIFGSFSLATGSLSAGVAIGGGATGASFTAASLSGRPCCQDGGGVGAAPWAVVAGGVDGAAAGGALVRGCDPGPPPGCCSREGVGVVGGDGLAAGCCCANTGSGAMTYPACKPVR